MINDKCIDYDEQDDCYDKDGNVCVGGLYDAGGHLIPEKWISYIVHINDVLEAEE